MVVKTVIMLSLFFVPLTVLATGIVTTAWMLFSLYIMSGLGMAGIGMGVMHDAIHGSYSKNKKINTLLGYTFNLIGANAVFGKYNTMCCIILIRISIMPTMILMRLFSCDFLHMPNIIGYTSFSTSIYGSFMGYRPYPG